MNYDEELIEVYNSFSTDYEYDTPLSVGWSDKDSQEKRFEILLNIGVTNEDSILDLGCGLGHMYRYINDKKQPYLKYTGVDINENSIRIAQKNNPDAVFMVSDIFNVNERYDYVLGSGTFTVKMQLNDIMKSIERAFYLCNKGVAFNFLNDRYASDPTYFLNGFNPKNFKENLDKIYSKVVLIENYFIDNQDFTIYIFK